MKSYYDGNPGNRSRAAANRKIRNRSHAAANNISGVIGQKKQVENKGYSVKNQTQIQTAISLPPPVKKGAGIAAQRQEVQATPRESELEEDKEVNPSLLSDHKLSNESCPHIGSTFPDVVQMGKTKGRLLLVQGAYMSGDRTTVGAALALYPEMSVVILFDQATKDKAVDIKGFYDASKADKSQQIILHQVANCKEEYARFTEKSRQTFESWNIGTEKNLGAPTPVTKGTDIVGEQFDEQPDESYKKIAGKWILGTLNIQEVEALDKWLRLINMPPGNYALLWVKTGAPTDEKAHHYTSPEGHKQLIESVKTTGRIPVQIGEQLPGIKTDPDLTKFWDNDFPLAKQGRIGQLKLYYHLAHQPGYDVVNIGMRSGALEGPPLMGMRTIFLEETLNMQSSRMEQMLASVPTYKRVILDAPPGAQEKRIWLDRLWKDAFSNFLTTQKVLPILEGFTNGNLTQSKLRQLLIDNDDLKAAIIVIKNNVDELRKDEFDQFSDGFLTKIKGALGDLPQEWKQKRFDEIKQQANDPISGEGFSKGEIAVITQLLQIKNEPVAHELEPEFYKRTRMKNVTDLSTFNPETEKQSQVAHLEEQARRRDRIRNNDKWIKQSLPDCRTIAGSAVLERRQDVYLAVKTTPHLRNCDLYDAYVKALSLAIKNNSLEFIKAKVDRGKIMPHLKGLNDLGTYHYEDARENSANKASFDIEYIIQQVGGRNGFYSIIFPEKKAFIDGIKGLDGMDIQTFINQYAIISAAKV